MVILLYMYTEKKKKSKLFSIIYKQAYCLSDTLLLADCVESLRHELFQKSNLDLFFYLGKGKKEKKKKKKVMYL